MHKECDIFLFTLQDDKADRRIKVLQEKKGKGVEQTKGNSLEGHEHDAIGFIQNKRRKTYKNNNRTTKSFQWKFLVGCILVESYFIYNFTNSRYLLNNM